MSKTIGKHGSDWITSETRFLFHSKSFTLFCCKNEADREFWIGHLPKDWVKVEPGKKVWRTYRCPVNGDGYRWKVQTLVTESGDYAAAYDVCPFESTEL